MSHIFAPPESTDASIHNTKKHSNLKTRNNGSHAVKIPKNTIMKNGVAYNGYMFNVIKGDSRWAQASVCATALVHGIFSVLALAESVQSHFLTPSVLPFVYVCFVSATDMMVFWLLGMYAFNLYHDVKNGKAKALFRHYADVFYVVPTVLIQTVYAFWALFAWRSAFGDKYYISATLDGPSLPYVAYVRWNFIMLLLVLGGMVVVRASLKALHALKNVEMSPLSYDTSENTKYTGNEDDDDTEDV